MKTVRFQSPYQDIGRPKSDEETIEEVNKLLELRCLELHVKEVRKRRNKIKIADIEHILSDFDTQKMS